MEKGLSAIESVYVRSREVLAVARAAADLAMSMPSSVAGADDLAALTSLLVRNAQELADALEVIEGSAQFDAIQKSA